MSEEHPTRVEQRDQMINGPQTNIAGDVHGPVLSGRFEGPVHVYTRSKIEELNEYLACAVANYERQTYQSVMPKIPTQPYKFLYAFDIEDTSIFFGRDAVSEVLHKTVLRDRMTILHARSGAGKTSLLRAGLSPRLIKENRLPVYAHVYEDPVLAIKRALVPPSSVAPWPSLLSTFSLHEFLESICVHLSRETRELVILLDQFEEFFVFWPNPDHRKILINALADCYEDKSLQVRFVIALRKDFYSDLATFQSHFPCIFFNEFYLKHMEREEARLAVTEPLAILHSHVRFTSDVVDKLLDELDQGGIELPYLQIACSLLYESLNDGEQIIDLGVYESLRGIEGILSNYLAMVLDRLPYERRELAREILKSLVSSEGTKRALSFNYLKARFASKDGELSEVLSRLVDDRLLHRDDTMGQTLYEIAHECLIAEIQVWSNSEDQEFKRVEELLMREIVNWRTLGIKIPSDRLKVLHVFRERFKGAEPEIRECIICSALASDSDIFDWIDLADKTTEGPLLTALDDSRESMRRAALYGLSKIWNIPTVSRLTNTDPVLRQAAAEELGVLQDPRTIYPLIVALRDHHYKVSEAAAMALKSMGAYAVKPLISALRNEDDRVRRSAAKVLGELGDFRAVEPLIVALRDNDGRVRQGVAETLGKLGHPSAIPPLVDALRDKKARLTVAQALTNFGAPAAEALIVALHDKDQIFRRVVVWVLGSLGEISVGPLVDALADDDYQVCQTSVKALEKIGYPSIRPLVNSLGEYNDSVKSWAVLALSKIGQPAVDSVFKKFIHANYDNERKWAVNALIGIGEPAIEPLISVLHAPDDKIRQWAVIALGEIGSSKSVQLLSKVLLQDGKGRIRQSAATALGMIGDPQSVESLQKAAFDKNSSVRNASLEAIKRIQSLEASP